MIHSERVEAEGKITEGDRERAGATDRETEKKRKHSNEWEEGRESVCLDLAFLLFYCRLRSYYT